MGCDGGTIPKRDELIKTKKNPEQKDKAADLAHKWNDCTISQLPLQKPIVACELGKLYSKESVLELLLDKTKCENSVSFAHITSLRDVKELNLTDNPELKRRGDKSVDMVEAPFVCPVTGLEMNGKQRFCFLWTCGCVLSERALKEIASEACHKCGKPFKAEDIVILNPEEAEMPLLNARMEERKAKAKLDKANRKSKKSKRSGEHNEEPAYKVSKDSSGDDKIDKGKALANGTDRVKNSTRATSGAEKATLKTTTVQKDPSTSAVFKSLFTSCEEAKRQPKMHPGWVSYNPQYFR